MKRVCRCGTQLEWAVTQHRFAYNPRKTKKTASEKSTVVCGRCKAQWRTKAEYVRVLCKL